MNPKQVDGLTVADLERIVALCDQFEDEWNAERDPRIEQFLEWAPAAGRPRLFRELIALELELRRQESPTTPIGMYRAEYRARFPAHAEVVDAICAAALPTTASPPSRLDAPRLPDYEIVGELGRGGMGVVYEARQWSLKRTVAIKTILIGPHAGPGHLDRFQREAEAAARLQHPNIAAIHQVGQEGEFPYLVLEYLGGGTLGQRLGGVPQPPQEAARLIHTLARAVHWAHHRGVIHRDLKPANVLFAEDGTPKLSDFGLAKLLDDEDEQGGTLTGEVFGSPSYMAFEQAAGLVRRIGPPTDVYALGAILYEMLTGRPPFHGTSHADILDQVRTREPVRPGRLQPKVPRDLETICLKCLEKDPDRRYRTAAELSDDLDRFLDGRPVRARSFGPIGRAWRRIGRHPRVAALSAVLVLVLVAGVTASTVLAGRWRAESANARRLASRAERRIDQSITGLEDLLGPVSLMLRAIDAQAANSIAVARQLTLLLLAEDDLTEADRTRLAWIMNWIAINEARFTTAAEPGLARQDSRRAVSLWESIRESSTDTSSKRIGLLYAKAILLYLDIQEGRPPSKEATAQVVDLLRVVQQDLARRDDPRDVYLIWLLHMIGANSGPVDGRIWAERTRALCDRRSQSGDDTLVLQAIRANNASFLAKAQRLTDAPIDEAVESIDHGIRLWREIIARVPQNVDHKLGLAHALHEKNFISQRIYRGDVHHPMFAAGIEALRSGIALLDGIEFTDNVSAAQRLRVLDMLVALNNNLGLELLKDPERWPESISPFEAIRSIYGRLPVVQPTGPGERFNYSYACYYLATIPYSTEDEPVDLGLLRECCRELDRVLEAIGDSPSPDLLKAGVAYQLELADALRRRGQGPEAEQAQARCRALCDRLSGDDLNWLVREYLGKSLADMHRAGFQLASEAITAHRHVILDQALVLIGEVVRRGHADAEALRMDPLFDPLRGNQRFIELIDALSVTDLKTGEHHQSDPPSQ